MLGTIKSIPNNEKDKTVLVNLPNNNGIILLTCKRPIFFITFHDFLFLVINMKIIIIVLNLKLYLSLST